VFWVGAAGPGAGGIGRAGCSGGAGGCLAVGSVLGETAWRLPGVPLGTALGMERLGVLEWGDWCGMRVKDVGGACCCLAKLESNLGYYLYNILLETE